MTTFYCPEYLELACGPVAAIDLALYAAAAGDHNPLHLDPDVALAAGFDRPVVHGMLSMAYAGRLFSTHFGPGALLTLNTRFTGIAKRGDLLVFTARLSLRDAITATYSVQGCIGSGAEVVSGIARVALSRDAMAGQAE